MTQDHNATLYTLGDRGQTIDGSDTDIRGRQVKDNNGEGVGKLAELLIDDRERKVRFLLVEHGGFLGFGQTTSLIPVDAITSITADDVVVDQSHDRVAAAPGYDPDLVDDRTYQSSIYSHYGYAPYWGAAYAYPGIMSMPPMTLPSDRR